MQKVIVILVSVMASLSLSAQDYKAAAYRTVEERLNAAYCSGMFESSHGTILDVASSGNARSYLNILTWLEGRVAGLQVYTSRNGTSVPMIRGGVPGIYVDEVPVTLSYLDMLNVNDIAIVKIIRSPFYGGFNSGNGAIAIYTLGTEDEEEEHGE